MENTPFDLNEAIRLWRAEFGSLHLLSADDLEELEGHLRDKTAALHAGGMPMEQAFRAALQRLGPRQVLSGEFAKIHPQRVWLERGVWMTAGLLLCQVLGVLSRPFSDMTMNQGIYARWNPALAVLASNLATFATIAVGFWLCWSGLRRRPSAFGKAADFCVQRPWLTGIALLLALRGTSLLLQSSIYARALDWISPSPARGPDFDHAWLKAIEWWSFAGWMVWNVVWAACLTVLATLVLRSRRWHTASPTGFGRRHAERVLWLERGLWMVTGSVLAGFLAHNVVGLGFLPCLWIQPASIYSLAMQHLIGFLAVFSGVALVVASIGIGWKLMTRHPRLSNWLKRIFRQDPLLAGLGLVLALNLPVILGLLLRGAGFLRSGVELGRVVSEWHTVEWTIALQVMPVVILLVLLRQRMKFLAPA